MDSSQNSVEIKEYLMRNPEWENFVQTILQETNDKNNTQIGGVNMKEMIAQKAEFVLIFCETQQLTVINRVQKLV